MANITQKQRAYDFLREKLIAGELPPGSRLSDIALSKEIGISRTPIREAINQLASEDLVELVPHNGAFVKIPDERELVELYDLRLLLERYAVTQAASQISEEHLAKLEEMIDSMDTIIKGLIDIGKEAPTRETRHRWVLTDYAFHLVLFRSCGNRKVMRIASELRMLTQAFIFQKDDPEVSPVDVMRQANEEHGELFRALKCGDATMASQIIERHIIRAKKKTVASYVGASKTARKGNPDWLDAIRNVINS